ncbi:MAG: hypothetical protein GWP03_01450 [Proteobacteria bacterium]|nr:hypothetical protein [Pseudomonadota bacterium]
MDQKKEKLIDKEYISFLSSQIKGNINDKLQISSTVLKYIVSLQYFKEIAVYDSSGKELFSMTKGSIGSDTTIIEKLIANPSDKDSLLFTGNMYIKVIQIKSVLNNTPIGEVVLVIIPHFKENYLMFIKRQLYLIGGFILLFLIIFIKFPDRQKFAIEQLSQEGKRENELVEILKGGEKKTYEECEVKREVDGKGKLPKIKKDIIEKLEEIISAMEKNERTENMEYNIGLKDSMENLNNDFKLFESNVIHLEQEDAAISEQGKRFILKLKGELSKIEYFANRLRILSYNAMILANSSESEGEGFKVVADEMANLSDRIFQFQNGIEDKIDKTNLETKSSTIEKIKGDMTIVKWHMENIWKDRENENEKLNKEITNLINRNKNKLIYQYKTVLNDFKLYLEDVFSNLNS